jgi:ATP-dependent DNA helicase PIF1
VASGVAHRYPTRSEVEEANDTRLAQITENTVSFCAVDRPGFDEKGERVSRQKMARLLNRLVALPTVILKVIRATSYCCFYSASARLALKSCLSRHVFSFEARAKLQPQLQNLEQGHLVNGTTGKVIGFITRFETACRELYIAGRKKLEDPKLAAVKRCSRLWPLVMFTNGSKRLCVPEEFSVTGARGNVEASRTQVREHHTAGFCCY